MNGPRALRHRIAQSAALALTVATLAGVAAGATAQPAGAATAAHYTWSGNCIYRWSNSWVKQGCLVRLNGRLYFHDEISRAWYLDIKSNTWWVKLYPTGWMRGDDYYRAWGMINTMNSSLYRQMCIKAFGKLC